MGERGLVMRVRGERLVGGGFEWVIFFFFFCVCIDSPFFSTQDSTSTYPNDYHGDHLRIRIPRTVQGNMRGGSRLGSFRSELRIGEIDAQGTCGGSGADMDWCACFYCGEKLVLGGSVLIFFFLSDHISPSLLPSLYVTHLPPAKSSTPRVSPRNPPPQTMCANGQ